MQELIEIVEKMKQSRVMNYVVAGLDSYLLSGGVVRLFECSRDHQDQITPHSHRFDFACLVLAGTVTNRIWEECTESEGDFFQSSKLTYKGDIGKHSVARGGRNWWRYTDWHYSAGDCYSMTADQVHSIQFSRGAKVLFLEGPQYSNTSLIIEPVVHGKVIPTYQKREYMFQRD